MNNPVHNQIHELTMLYRNSDNPSVKRYLAFKINGLERSLWRRFPQPAPVTLRTWLLAGNGVELVPSRSPHASVNPQPRLKDAVRSIFGGVMKDLRAILLREKSHGRISLDTIIVCKGTGKLINSLDLDGNANTYRADYDAIAAVLTEIVGHHAFPADVAHFMEIISREELPTGVLQTFVLSHPAFWTGTEIVRNVIALRSAFYLCGILTQIEFENATLEIPHWLTDNRQFEVQQLPNGLSLMAFYRNALLHAHEEGILLTQNEIENELYAMFPDFLAYFIERTYHLAIVRGTYVSGKCLYHQ